MKHVLQKACLTGLMLLRSLCAEAKIRVLIVDGFSNHDWRQTTLLTKNVLEQSGLFSVDISTAPAMADSPGWDAWRPAFTNYDVVVQNCNSYGNRPNWPREVQLSLEQFVKNGGGLYILHSANNSFPSEQETPSFTKIPPFSENLVSSSGHFTY